MAIKSSYVIRIKFGIDWLRKNICESNGYIPFRTSKYVHKLKV